jgi:hypothetical protein
MAREEAVGLARVPDSQRYVASFDDSDNLGEFRAGVVLSPKPRSFYPQGWSLR